MASPSIKGKLYDILPLTFVTETFAKREFVLEYIENPQYPEYLLFQLVGEEKARLLDSFKVGDEVEVFFNFKGRSWTPKVATPSNPYMKKVFFNSLQAWSIKSLTPGGYVKPSSEAYHVPPETNPYAKDGQSEFDFNERKKHDPQKGLKRDAWNNPPPDDDDLPF